MVFLTVISAASMRMVASSGPLPFVAPSPADHLVVALDLASVVEAVVDRGTLLMVGARAGSGRTEASLSCRCGVEGRSETAPRRLEAELSACCTVAVSRRSWSLP